MGASEATACLTAVAAGAGGQCAAAAGAGPTPPITAPPPQEYVTCDALKSGERLFVCKSAELPDGPLAAPKKGMVRAVRAALARGWLCKLCCVLGRPCKPPAGGGGRCCLLASQAASSPPPCACTHPPTPPSFPPTCARRTCCSRCACCQWRASQGAAACRHGGAACRATRGGPCQRASGLFGSLTCSPTILLLPPIFLLLPQMVNWLDLGRDTVSGCRLSESYHTRLPAARLPLHMEPTGVWQAWAGCCAAPACQPLYPTTTIPLCLLASLRCPPGWPTPSQSAGTCRRCCGGCAATPRSTGWRRPAPELAHVQAASEEVSQRWI